MVAYDKWMLRIVITYAFSVLNKLNATANLAAENTALRQQLSALNRKNKRPALKKRDRLPWVLLSRIWPGWRDALLIVKPDTVLHWQKKAFKAYWRRKCEQGKPGRPPLDPNFRALVLQMANANPLWSAPKIHGELLELGIEVAERMVSSIIKRRKTA